MLFPSGDRFHERVGLLPLWTESEKSRRNFSESDRARTEREGEVKTWGGAPKADGGDEYEEGEEPGQRQS